MPGRRLASVGSGDRAEIFAQYVLSTIAAVVPVPRQVDFGFDFFCTLTHFESGLVYAGKSFGVQVKSVSNASIKYGGIDKKGEWRSHEIKWLFGQSQPLLLCIADIEQLEIRLYSTSRMWWVRWKYPEASEIILCPDLEPSNIWGEEPCYKTQVLICDSNVKSGDGYSYQVPLGTPIVQISLKDKYSKEATGQIIDCLNYWLSLDYRNIANHQANIPYAEVRSKSTINKARNAVVMLHHHTNNERDAYVKEMLHSIAPAIESLIRNLGVQGQRNKIGSVVPIAGLAQSYGAHFQSAIDKLIKDYFTGGYKE